MAGGGGGEGELNLVPYMDIMVNLIMFMLVVTAYLVELREAPVLAPQYNSGAGQSTEKPKAFLSVNIVPQGIVILGSNIAINQTIPVQNGQYAFDAFQQFLRETKDNPAYDISPNLVIAAQGTVPYKVIVKAMDAARQDKQGELFPGVTLALAVQ
jgi:biopolymer transport protein ExbD